MTIYLDIVYTSVPENWDYGYPEFYDLLCVKRSDRQIPQSTLQGSWNLIIDVDAAQIVSYVEPMTIAAPRYWQVLPTLEPPVARPGRAYLKMDVDDGQPQAYFTNPNYSTFYARLGEPSGMALQHIAVGRQVLIDVTTEGMLVGMWLLDLPSIIGEWHAVEPKI